MPLCMASQVGHADSKGGVQLLSLASENDSQVHPALSQLEVGQVSVQFASQIAGHAGSSHCQVHCG